MQRERHILLVYPTRGVVQGPGGVRADDGVDYLPSKRAVAEVCVQPGLGFRGRLWSCDLSAGGRMSEPGRTRERETHNTVKELST